MQLQHVFHRNMYALERLTGSTVYYCDNEKCGQFRVEIKLTPEEVEDRAMRHIIREIDNT